MCLLIFIFSLPPFLTYLQILSRIVRDRLAATGDIQQDDNLNFTALAMQTEGYAASDLQDLVSRAVHQVAMRITRDPSASVSFTCVRFVKMSHPDNRAHYQSMTSLLPKLTSSH